jgi:hypothetical protein
MSVFFCLSKTGPFKEFNSTKYQYNSFSQLRGAEKCESPEKGNKLRENKICQTKRITEYVTKT